MTSQLVLKEIAYAPKAWELLRGCICLYKPAKKGFAKTQLALRQKIVQELNSMEVRPPRERIVISGDLTVASSEDSANISPLKVDLQPNLADHPLVSGPRYAEDHLSLRLLNNPGWYGSGIVLGLIGPTAARGRLFAKHRFPKIYEVKGEFGFATDNNRDDGKVFAKCNYKHIKREYYDRILSKIEAAQRAQMFKIAGHDLRSEAAYQMAIEGTAVPASNQTAPLIYAIRSVNFSPPNFTIQVQTINEHEAFLASLIAEIGLAVKSMARCTGIRLIKLGPFTVEQALLQKHWTLENILENIVYCNKLMRSYRMLEPEKRPPSVEKSALGPDEDGVRL